MRVMQLWDQCSVPSLRWVLLCGGSAYEGISRLIKHSHSHAAIRFDTFAVHIRIRKNEITPILILCAQFSVAFAFVIHIRSIHKWNLSFTHVT